MKKIVLFLFAFAIFNLQFSTANAQTLADVQTAFQNAAAAMGSKNYAQAITLFEQVITEGDTIQGAEELVQGAKTYLPAAMFQKGGGEFQAGRLDAALGSFSQAAEFAELYGNVSVMNNARTWIGRTVLRQGADAFNNKDYATAAAIFQKGYDGNPNDMDVALNLALSYSEMGDYAKGNRIYRNIIALDGRNSRFDAAVATAKEKFLFYAQYRASQAAESRDYNAIIAAANDYLEEFPLDAWGNMTRLQAYNSLRDYARVIEFGDETILTQQTPEAKSTANYIVAAAYQNRENYPKAIEYYRRVSTGQYAASARTQVTELQKVVK